MDRDVSVDRVEVCGHALGKEMNHDIVDIICSNVTADPWRPRPCDQRFMTNMQVV